MRDEGVSSVQFLLASALALILFLTFANLVVVQYGRGVIRSALEQGVRAGSISGSVSDCEAKAMEVVDHLLGGRLSDGLVIDCQVASGVMVATGSARFEGWTVMTPDFVVTLTAEGVVEWAG